MIHLSGGIDIQMIGEKAERGLPVGRQAWRPDPSWKAYLISVALVTGASVLTEGVSRLLSPTNLVMPYLLAVVIAAVRWGRGPSIVTAVLGVLAYDFLYIPLRHSFAVSDTQYMLTLAALLIVGLVISALTVQAHEQAGALKVFQRPCEVRDIIGASLRRLADLLKSRPVTVEIGGTAAYPVDFSLMVKVLVNVLDNAVKYSLPDSPI